MTICQNRLQLNGWALHYCTNGAPSLHYYSIFRLTFTTVCSVKCHEWKAWDLGLTWALLAQCFVIHSFPRYSSSRPPSEQLFPREEVEVDVDVEEVKGTAKMTATSAGDLLNMGLKIGDTDSSEMVTTAATMNSIGLSHDRCESAVFLFF